MSRGFFPQVLMLLVVVLLWGCAQTPSSVTTPSSDDAAVAIEDGAHASQWQSEWRYDFGEPCELPMFAGQHIEVGTVFVTNDLTNVYVTYETIDCWFMTETHMHVAKSVEDIPQKNGNPIPGQFDYKTDHDPPVQTYTYVVEICSIGDGGWGPGDELVIAAHADVQCLLEENGEEEIWEETAWAGDEDFPGRNWATYGICTIKCVMHNCLVVLPGSPVNAQFTVYNWCRRQHGVPGPSPTWGFWEIVVLSNVPAGWYSVWDGFWPGWCLEQTKRISGHGQPEIYTVTLFSSQGSNLPGYAALCDWERINYILNHKHPAASLCDIQQAMWYFTPDGHEIQTPIAQAMVDDALLNGGGYHPGANWNEVEAVILDAGEPYQITFIEVGCIPVDKPCDDLCP